MTPSGKPGGKTKSKGKGKGLVPRKDPLVACFGKVGALHESHGNGSNVYSGEL